MKTIVFGILTLLLAACSITQVNSNSPAQVSLALREKIRDAIRTNQRGFQICYESLLARDAKAQGKVVIEWQVGESGKVSGAKFLSTDFKDTTMNDCMKSAMEKIEFPPAPKDQLYVVSYPFVFKLE